MSATEHRDLRTGTPVWSLNPTHAVPTAGKLPKSADVLVIGAGVSGALAADALVAAGLQVVIIDRRTPGAGSTAASTALLQFELDLPLSKLREDIGDAAAARAWRRSQQSVEILAARVRTLNISCDFRRRQALYLSGNVLSPTALETEAHLRRIAGLPSRFLPAATVKSMFGISGRAGILSDGAAEVNPARLTAGLLRSVIRRGAKVVAPVTVADVSPGEKSVTVHLEDGRALTAGHVVFATGYELAKGVPRRGHSITSTWSIATRPQPEKLWPGRALIWEAADPYLYIRTTVDGRVICGGEDAEFDDEETRDRLLPKKAAKLAAKLAALIPGIDTTPELAWAGSFGDSKTGLPTIGPVPRMNRCHAILGFGGNGITFSAMAAEIISRSLQGLDDPDSDLFAFDRR